MSTAAAGMQDASGSGPSDPGQQQQPNPAEELRRKRINNAVTFLNNANVKASPLSRRVNFLKSKGLEPEDIQEAFQKAGQEMTLDRVKNIINNTPTQTEQQQQQSTTTAAAAQQPVPPPAAAPAPMQPQPAGAYHPHQHQHQQYMHPQHQHHHVHPHHVMGPAPPPPLQSSKWKDYFIGGTVVLAGAAAAAYAINNYSPYTFVRKGADSDAQMPQTTKKRKTVKNGSRPILQNFQNTSDENTSIADADSRLNPSSSPPRRVSSQGDLPPPPPPTTRKEELAEMVAKEVARQQSSQKEIDTITAELTAAKDDLEKLRKEKAELAVNNAKLKGQIQTLSRQSERNSTEVQRLTAEVDRLEEDKRELEKKVPQVNVASGSEAEAGSENVKQSADALGDQPANTLVEAEV